MSLAERTRLGSYEIIAPLGAGGMGEVYRASDPKLRREVAIKILPAAFAADPDRLARFEREVHSVAALSHPNILAIHDFGTDRGITYAVMELLAGQTLRDVLSAGPLPRRKGIEYAAQIASGLDAAHARGIVHRDLKPENVFVSSGGHIKIVDFGLAVHRAPASTNANSIQTTDGATHAGGVLGTPGYMSPEQVRGEAADHRSDIFSFGCVLYEMLSGRRAFEGESSIDAMHAILRSDPRDLSTLAGVPTPLARIVTRCLEKAPGERFQSARDLAFALEAVAEPRDAQDAARLPRTRRGLLSRAAVVAAIAAVAAAIAWSVWANSRPSDAPPAAGVIAPQPRGMQKRVDSVKVESAKKETSEDPRKELVSIGTSWSGEAFLEAVKTGDLRLVKLFVAGGMRIASATSQGRPLPVMLALNVANAGEVLDVLVDGGLEINHSYEIAGGLGPIKTTLLSRAIERGNADLVRALLRHQVNVNTAIQTFGVMGIARNTYPLAAAVSWQQVEIAAALLDNGADPAVGDFAAYRETDAALRLARGDEPRHKLQALMARLAPSGNVGTRIDDELRLQAVERELNEVARAGLRAMRGTTQRVESDRRYDELQQERTTLRQRLGGAERPR